MEGDEVEVESHGDQLVEMIRSGGFTEVEQAGSLSLEDLGPNKELFLFRMPDGMIEPSKLIDKKLLFGTKKSKHIVVDDHQLTVVSYDSSQVELPSCVFLPDERGEYHQANLNIAGQIVLRKEPVISETKNMIDIDSLRSVCHKPPSDIKQRSFLNSKAVDSEKENEDAGTNSPIKGDKRKIDEDNDLVVQDDEVHESPKKKKKKKKDKNKERVS